MRAGQRILRQLRRGARIGHVRGVLGDDAIYLEMQTSQSEVRIAQAARLQLFNPEKPVESSIAITEEPAYIGQHFEVKMVAGQIVQAEKIVALFTSRDRAIFECGLAAREAIRQAADFETLRHQKPQARHPRHSP